MPVNYYTTADHLDYLSGKFGPLEDETDLFQFDLPIPPELDATKRKGWVIQIKEGSTFFGIGDEDGSDYTSTVWGYARPGKDAGYLGPTFIAEAGNPIRVNYVNHLPMDGHLLPVDYNLHIASPGRFTLTDGSVPTITHLHGGKNRSDSDGLPDQWAIQSNREHGSLWKSPVQTYDNDQSAATLWYHDHALGMTRLNVYAGLAGFYLLTDDVERGLLSKAGQTPATLPGSDFTAPMVLQDKAFTPDGQLYFPAHNGDILPGTTDSVTVPDDPDFVGDATALPEFFGNVIMVNGMAWPNLDVDPGMWRFRLLNGSDSRFYVLDFDEIDTSQEVSAFLVGTDGGLLPNAIELTDGFVLEPGGRLDIVVDFTGFGEGAEILLKNSGPAFDPFKGFDENGVLVGEAADDPEFDAQGDPVLVDNVMKFTVGADRAGNDPGNGDIALSDGTALAGDTFRVLDPNDATETRKLGLFEGTDEFGRIQPLLGVAQNTTDINGNQVGYGPQLWAEAVTEDPELGSTEIWEFYNFTEDAHPVHVHLVQYQVLEKRKIWFQDEDEDGIPDDRGNDGDLGYETGPFVSLNGTDEFDWTSVGDDVDVVVSDELELIPPEETGNQDTVWVGPGEMFSAVMEFEKAGPYVWHCHILSHEDHEMMRPYEVVEPDLVTA